MSSQDIGQRFRVSRGGCWQSGTHCRSRLAEVLTFSQVAYNVELADRPRSGGWRQAGVMWRRLSYFKQTALGGLVKPDRHGTSL